MRDYGTATWEGGDAACDHRQPGTKTGAATTLRNDGRAHKGPYEGESALTVGFPYKGICGKCGARRIDQQIGLEESPEIYVAKLVDVFREVRRILHPTGVVFLNLGDSYNGSGGSGGDYGPGGLKEGQPTYPGRNVNGLGPKQLLGMPWRTAFALQADGWVLRQDIIWGKTAPMPESVTDRCTKSHEYVFLLAKNANYFYDADAIAEPALNSRPDHLARHLAGDVGTLQRKPRDFPGAVDRQSSIGFVNPNDPSTRNKRSVWTLGPESYAGAHFATFPTKLVEPMILAGSSAHGCCSACRSPWARVVERGPQMPPVFGGKSHEGQEKYLDDVRKKNSARWRSWKAEHPDVDCGWSATCTCGADVIPCTILDPFVGSGTVGFVSLRHGRNFIGVDLNADYLELARTRIEQSQPMLFEV